jgi:hypothetical protein
MTDLQKEVIEEIVYSISTWKHNHSGVYEKCGFDIMFQEKATEIECALIDLFKMIKSIEG